MPILSELTSPHAAQKVLSQGEEFLYGLTYFSDRLSIIGANSNSTPCLASLGSGERQPGDPMSLIACPSPEILYAFALGELPETELNEVAEHLDACTQCDEQAGRLDRADDAILVGLKLVGDPALRTLIADQEAEGSG
jgi:hypothetical protein